MDAALELCGLPCLERLFLFISRPWRDEIVRIEIFACLRERRVAKHLIQRRGDASVAELCDFCEGVDLAPLIQGEKRFSGMRREVIGCEVPRTDAVELHHHTDELVELHSTVPRTGTRLD